MALQDSYWLSQSTVFKNRVAPALIDLAVQVDTETIGPNSSSGQIPFSVHQLRKQQSANILNFSQFQNWLTQFTFIAACNAAVIAAALSSTTTAFVGSSQADAAAASSSNPLISDTLINNAVFAGFQATIPSA